ncbi:MAG: DUF134 domain-containing protein [Firmicutes bacterium]|nr:DUF134 domain-containing protein [Bacillota bacterium]
MPRPCKRRRICALPACRRFAPADSQARSGLAVAMTVDEYEAIRLIDWQGLTQEKCAEQMGVARTTVQSIYTNARKKLADCLVNRRELKIEGGEYLLCDGQAVCGCEKCPKRTAGGSCRQAGDGAPQE